MKDLLQYRNELLCGEKITLRGTTAEDEAILAKWWNEETMLLGNRSRIVPTFTEENSSLFHSWSSNQARTGFGLTIENKQGEVVGHITAFNLSMPEMIATIGILVEAMRKAIRICFEELNAHKVELNVFSYNENAIKMYEKVGFVLEGRRRAASYHRGQYFDVLTMGILREEYFVK